MIAASEQRVVRTHRRAFAQLPRRTVLESAPTGRGYPFGPMHLWGLRFDGKTCTVYKGGVIHGAVPYYSPASTDVDVGGDEHYVIADFAVATKGLTLDATTDADEPENVAGHFRFPVAMLRRYGSEEDGWSLALAWYPVGASYVNTGIFL